MDSEKITDLEWALSYADERASEGNASTEGMRILAAEVRRLNAETAEQCAALDRISAHHGLITAVPAEIADAVEKRC